MSQQDIGIVVIGRNEGVRLRQCLESIVCHCQFVVYVDSGSTDDSITVALGLGVEVVSLDILNGFSAARARNAGASLLLARPGVRYLQFVDGDCEVARGWLEVARRFLDSNAGIAAVCGRRRERHPNQSIYNLMCDLEWATPIGIARYFGGDVMIRSDYFLRVGGYREDLIAGEDPEIGVRLRKIGGVLWRLDEEMTLHDAAITRLGQWWYRALRGGYAFAQGAAIHGAAPERHWVRECFRAWVWGLFFPLAAGISLILGQPYITFAIIAIYPLQWFRLIFLGQGSFGLRISIATFLLLGKFAEACGQVMFIWHHIIKRRVRLIEYK